MSRKRTNRKFQPSFVILDSREIPSLIPMPIPGFPILPVPQIGPDDGNNVLPPDDVERP